MRHDVGLHQDTPDSYTLVESVKTQVGARTMALDRKTGRAFLSGSRVWSPASSASGRPAASGADDSRQLHGSDRRRIVTPNRISFSPPDQLLIPAGHGPEFFVCYCETG